MSRSSTLRIAYLTSQYARASDSFIRGEVEQLRRLGCQVKTFSIRAPETSQLVSAEIRREREATDDILGHSLPVLLAHLLMVCLQHPVRSWEVLRVAMACSTPGLKGRLWVFAYWLEAAYLSRQLSKHNIQHLHNHIGEGSATVAMLAATWSAIPFSITMHGPNEFDRPTLIAIREKAKRAAFVIAISRFGRSQILRWIDFADWGKVHVVRCGVGDKFLEHESEPISAPRQFVSVGRLAEQKGQMVLVEAAARLVEREVTDFHVTLVGDGPLRHALEEAIEREDLESHFSLVGWQSAEAVREAIEAAGTLVLPSFAEGLPVVFMEALALGRPVIATRIAGHPELIDDEVGWLVPPADSIALADAMHQALQADNLADKASVGRRRVEQMHNARTESERLLRLIEAAVVGGSVPPWDPELDEAYSKGAELDPQVSGHGKLKQPSSGN